MIQHTPPSTYLLRDFVDVTIPESVSWMPQTVGWKVLGALLLIVFALLVIRTIDNWWHNRYRREALNALRRIEKLGYGVEDALFSVLKVVLVHVHYSNAKLFGRAFLKVLDETTPNSKSSKVKLDGVLYPVKFDDDLGERWLVTLISKESTLSESERSLMMMRSQYWVKHHSNESLNGRRRFFGLIPRRKKVDLSTGVESKSHQGAAV